jgi:hypothetical protein
MIFHSLLLKMQAISILCVLISKSYQVIQLRKACSHPYLFNGIEPEPYEEGEHLVQVYEYHMKVLV